MKKILGSIILILIIIGYIHLYIVNKVFISINLPHEAIMHIVPASLRNNSHSAVIICPGGGYSSLAKWSEGFCWIPFYHQLGYTIAILEYRMPHQDYRKPVIDGSEAIKYMRTQSNKWGIEKVGIMGFSSGGHLVSSLLVSENPSVRPDFAILYYPVISMRKDITHLWTHDNLLGKNCSNQLEMQFSNELHVSRHAPPTYITLSSNDNIVNPKNSMRFYQAMITKGCPATIKIYPTGGHGWGYHTSFAHHDQMLLDLKSWLKGLDSLYTNQYRRSFSD